MRRSPLFSFYAPTGDRVLMCVCLVCKQYFSFPNYKLIYYVPFTLSITTVAPIPVNGELTKCMVYGVFNNGCDIDLIQTWCATDD